MIYLTPPLDDISHTDAAMMTNPTEAETGGDCSSVGRSTATFSEVEYIEVGAEDAKSVLETQRAAGQAWLDWDARRRQRLLSADPPSRDSQDGGLPPNAAEAGPQGDRSAPAGSSYLPSAAVQPPGADPMSLDPPVSSAPSPLPALGDIARHRQHPAATGEPMRGPAGLHSPAPQSDPMDNDTRSEGAPSSSSPISSHPVANWCG